MNLQNPLQLDFRSNEDQTKSLFEEVKFHAPMESEAMYRFIFQNNPQPMWIADMETLRFLEVNHAAIAHYGYSNEEFLSMTIKDIRPESEVGRLMLDVENCRKSDVYYEWSGEGVHKKKNGELIDVDIKGQTVIYNGKQVSHIIVNDITGRKRYEKLLEQTRLNYEGFFNAIDEMIFVLNPEGRIIHTNDMVLNRLGYSRDELTGKPMDELHPAELRAQAGQIMCDMLEGVAESCLMPLVTRAGVIISVETRISRGLWDGNPVLFGFSKDISKIRLSEEKFSKVFNLNLSACGLTHLKYNKIIEVNEAFCSLLGYTREEVSGKAPYEIGISRYDAENELLDRIRSQGTIRNKEIKLRTKTGDVKYALLSAEIINIQDNKYLYAVFHDITELKKAENEIKNKIELLTNLITNLGKGVLLENSDREIILTNQLFCDMFGVPAPPEALVGSDCTNAADGFKHMFVDQEGFVNGINEILLHKQQALNQEFELTDGRYFERDYIPTLVDDNYTGHLWKYRDITDRKLAEKKIMLQNTRLNAILQAIPDLMFVFDKDGNYLEYYSNASGLLSVPDNELIGHNVKDFFDNAQSEVHMRHISNCIANKKVVTYEYTHYSIRGDGYFEARLVPYGDHVLALVRDINERYIARAELLDSRVLYQSSLEQMPAGVIRFNHEGRVVFVNSVYCDLEEMEAADIEGKTFDELIAQAQPGRCPESSGSKIFPCAFTEKDKEHHEWIIATGEMMQYEKDCCRADGTTQYLHVVKYPVYSSTGKIIGSHGIQFDISERKRAEQALQLQFSLQKLLMEISAAYINLPVETINISLNDSLGDIARFVMADRAYIFDYDFTENITNNTHEWCAEGVIPQLSELQRVPVDDIHDWISAHTQGEHFAVNDVLALPEGSQLREILEPQEIKSLLTVPLMSKGECIGFVGFDWVKYHHVYNDTEFRLLKAFSQMIVNIWQRQWSEESLIESQKQLKSFAAHLQNVREEERVVLAREIHDDLGQKVVALKIDVGLLKQKIKRDNLDPASDIVLSKLDNLLELIDNTIKSTRRILSGLRPEMLEVLGFAASVNNYLEDFGKRYNIGCEFDCAIPDFDINAQKSLALYRIIQEAFNNIAKHSLATQSTIRLFLNGDMLVMEIADNGIGFPHEVQVRSDAYGLVGMKERVFLLDGKLSVESKKGAGTTIRVEIPYDGTAEQ